MRAFQLTSTVALVLILGFLFGFSYGCSVVPEEEGVVARVNGEAIHFSQLEAKHDLKYLARTSRNASLDLLREEYGDALLEIVVQRLVAQFLAQRGMAVSPEELEAAEALVRADYPEGVFDQILLEEYIDLETWREQLKATLGREKLFQNVFKPGIAVDYQEVDAYYRENIADFYLPPKTHFLLVQGQDREVVANVLELSQSDIDPEALGKRFDKADVHAYSLREENIPADWRSFLESLEPGQATDILVREGQGFQALILLERTAGRIVDPAQAYPLVERILLERKLLEAFESWLTNTVREARIEVNDQLLRRSD